MPGGERAEVWGIKAGNETFVGQGPHADVVEHLEVRGVNPNETLIVRLESPPKKILERLPAGFTGVTRMTARVSPESKPKA